MEYLEMQKGKASFTLSLENHLDEDVHHPEFNQWLINTLPGDSGFAVIAGLRVEY